MPTASEIYRDSFVTKAADKVKSASAENRRRHFAEAQYRTGPRPEQARTPLEALPPPPATGGNGNVANVKAAARGVAGQTRFDPSQVPGARVLVDGLSQARSAPDSLTAVGQFTRALPAAGADLLVSGYNAFARPAMEQLGRFGSTVATGDPDAWRRGIEDFSTGFDGGGGRSPQSALQEVQARGRRIPAPVAANGSTAGRISSGEAFGPGVVTDPSRGNITAMNSARGVALGDRANMPVNYVDFAGANEEFAEANRIRQRAIDAQPRGAGVVVPGDPVSDIYDRAEALMAQARGTNDAFDRSGLIRSANLVADRAGTMADMGTANDRNRAIIDQALISSEGAAARTQETAAAAAQRKRMELEAMGPYREAMAADAMARAERSLNGEPLDPADLETFGALGLLAYDEEGNLDPSDPLTGALLQSAFGGISFATGGMVPPVSAVQSYADGGMVGGAPAMPAQPLLLDYQAYARGATEKGLQPVGFEQFLQLKQGAQQRTIGMADGGPVPDASGKMVVDPDPNAPTDSIPAMIDGEQPAALDSGEFVIPKDAVLFYGTDKLQKMIDKARKPADGGQPQQPGAAGVSAIAAAGA